MNSQTEQAAPDLEVVMMESFADAWAEDPVQALSMLQMMVLHEATCFARVAFLQMLMQEGDRPSELVLVASFRSAFDLFRRNGLFRAYQDDRLTPDVVGRLDALTRHPEALLEAHRTATEARGPDELVASDETKLPGAEDTELPNQASPEEAAKLARFTELFRALGSKAEAKLRPWIPFRLQHAGLLEGATARDAEALADRFLAFIRPRFAELNTARFRDRLPVWIREFSTAIKRTEAMTEPAREDYERGGVAMTLATASPDETAWARGFREAALAANLANPRAILSFVAEEAKDQTALPIYRRGLFREAYDMAFEGMRLFECEEP